MTHPFRLENPPVGAAEVIEAAIAAITFPWDLLNGATVRVRWGDERMGQVSGLYYSSSDQIVMSDKPMHLDTGAGFVFAHEVGHMVDDMALNDAARAGLLRLMHPGIQIGHVNHDHPDTGHAAPDDRWWNGGESYVGLHYEAWADLFVAAFAPTVWDGTYLAGAPQRGPRFVHWTNDLAEVRRVVLSAAPASAPVTAQRAEPQEAIVTPHRHPKLHARIRGLRERLRRLRRRVRRMEQRRQ